MEIPLFKKILIPIDFSPCSEEAFRIAVSLAKLFQAEVLLLHVIDTKSLEALNRLGHGLSSRREGAEKAPGPSRQVERASPLGIGRREGVGYQTRSGRRISLCRNRAPGSSGESGPRRHGKL